MATVLYIAAIVASGGYALTRFAVADFLWGFVWLFVAVGASFGFWDAFQEEVIGRYQDRPDRPSWYKGDE